jgi:hypothetical protein
MLHVLRSANLICTGGQALREGGENALPSVAPWPALSRFFLKVRILCEGNHCSTSSAHWVHQSLVGALSLGSGFMCSGPGPPAPPGLCGASSWPPGLQLSLGLRGQRRQISVQAQP